MAEFINLTPHSINIQNSEGNVIEIPPSGNIARVDTEIVHHSEIDGIEIVDTKFKNPSGVPEKEFGKFFIVSRIVKNLIPDRMDVFVPGQTIRDENGNVVACKNLSL